MGTAPPSVREALSSAGQPLTPETRAFFEPRFGRDLSEVRVYTGGAAEQSARDVRAHAYTVGHNIVFGLGRFAPGTYAGRRLIAHELTHTLQQQGPGVIRRHGIHTALTDQGRYEHTLQHAGTNLPYGKAAITPRHSSGFVSAAGFTRSSPIA